VHTATWSGTGNQLQEDRAYFGGSVNTSRGFQSAVSSAAASSRYVEEIRSSAAAATPTSSSPSARLAPCSSQIESSPANLRDPRDNTPVFDVKIYRALTRTSSRAFAGAEHHRVQQPDRTKTVKSAADVCIDCRDGVLRRLRRPPPAGRQDQRRHLPDDAAYTRTNRAFFTSQYLSDTDAVSAEPSTDWPSTRCSPVAGGILTTTARSSCSRYPW